MKTRPFQFKCYLSFTLWMLVFSYIFTLVLSGNDVKKLKKNPKDKMMPYFDQSTPTNITVQLGSTAYLPCRLKNWDGEKMISFIRQKDAYILTVDLYKFITDDRISSFFTKETETWNLQIKYTGTADVGVYECQLSTEPKISRFFNLNVIVPKTKMDGEPEAFVKAGSTVSLRCIISRTLEEPSFIFWYQDSERVLNEDRRLINTERTSLDTIVSQLTIHNTRRKDSGNYSCNPSNLQSANTILHVLNGEEPAAMQHGNSGWLISNDRIKLLLFSLTVISRFIHKIYDII